MLDSICLECLGFNGARSNECSFNCEQPLGKHKGSSFFIFVFWFVPFPFVHFVLHTVNSSLVYAHCMPETAHSVLVLRMIPNNIFASIVIGIDE